MGTERKTLRIDELKPNHVYQAADGYSRITFLVSSDGKRGFFKNSPLMKFIWANLTGFELVAIPAGVSIFEFPEFKDREADQI